MHTHIGELWKSECDSDGVSAFNSVGSGSQAEVVRPLNSRTQLSLADLPTLAGPGFRPSLLWS